MKSTGWWEAACQHAVFALAPPAAWAASAALYYSSLHNVLSENSVSNAVLFSLMEFITACSFSVGILYHYRDRLKDMQSHALLYLAASMHHTIAVLSMNLCVSLSSAYGARLIKYTECLIALLYSTLYGHPPTQSNWLWAMVLVASVVGANFTSSALSWQSAGWGFVSTLCIAYRNQLLKLQPDYTGPAFALLHVVGTLLLSLFTSCTLLFLPFNGSTLQQWLVSLYYSVYQVLSGLILMLQTPAQYAAIKTFNSFAVLVATAWAEGIPTTFATFVCLAIASVAVSRLLASGNGKQHEIVACALVSLCLGLLSLQNILSGPATFYAGRSHTRQIVHVVSLEFGCRNNTGCNWGDTLNLFLASVLGNPNKYTFKPSRQSVENGTSTEPLLLGAGSIADIPVNCSGPVYMWGTGMIRDAPMPARAQSWHITGVRGKYTQAAVKHGLGRDTAITGDPAVLLPKLPPFNSMRANGTKLCIIPHYVDIDMVMQSALFRNISFVSILSKTPHDFIKSLLQCGRTMSSSLHGIIASHAFGIKSKHILLSDNVVGDRFKFKDYYSSVGLLQEAASLELNVSNPTSFRRQLQFAMDVLDASTVPDMTELHCRLLTTFPFELSPTARRLKRSAC